LKILEIPGSLWTLSPNQLWEQQEFFADGFQG
jgi:hypothetical protein